MFLFRARGICASIVFVVCALFSQQVLSQDQSHLPEKKVVKWQYTRDLQENQIIDASSLSGAFANPADLPIGAIDDDGCTALERRVLRKVKKDDTVLYSDCFRSEQLKLADQINMLQGTVSMRKAAARHAREHLEEDARVQAIYCRRDIPKGKNITLSDIAFKKVLLTKLPAWRAADIWTVIDRQAKRDLKAGERLQLADVMSVREITRLYHL